MDRENTSLFVKWLLVWGVSIAAFACTLTTTSIMTAVPMMAQELGLSDSQATWTVSVYMLGAASLIILSSRLGDLFSPRYTFYAGNLLFLIGSIFVAMASNAYWLFLGRIIQGFGAALIIPNSLALIKETFNNKDKVNIGIGIWSGVLALGFAMGPLFAGSIIDTLGWRYIFWLNIPITILSYLICLFIKNPERVKRAIKIDYIGQITLIISIFLIAFALTQSIQWGLANAWTWIVLAIGVAIFILFYYLEKYVEQPTILFTIFKNRQFSTTIILIFLTFYALITVLLIYNLFVQNPVTLAYDPMEAGLSLLPTTLALFILSFIMPKLGNKVGFRYPSIICFLLMSIGFLLFFFTKPTVSYENLWIGLLLIGLGLGGTFPCFTGVALSGLPIEKTGLGSGIVSATVYATGIISTAIGSLIYIKISFNHIVSHLSHLNNLPKNQLLQFAMNVSTGKSLETILHGIPQYYQSSMLATAKIANIHAFHVTMLVAAILCLIGSVLSFTGIKAKE